MSSKVTSTYKNIKEAYNEDQREREETNWENIGEVELLFENDLKRKAYAYYMLENKLLRSGQDYYYAAMIFHHSDGVSDLALAVALSFLSMSLCNTDGRWLYARALDRFSLKMGKPQKFGTQFEKKNEKWKLCNYDKNTTDEERAVYDVPSLDHQKNVRAMELDAEE